MTVNRAWKGRRFRSNFYAAFRRDILRLLARLKPQKPRKDAPLFVHYRWGVSNIRTDVDNPTKPFQDILFDYWDLNDEKINFLILEKKKVAKGEEYISWVADDREALCDYLEMLIQGLREEK